MEALRKVKLSELEPTPPSTGSVSLTTPSGPPLPEGMGWALSTLMAQTQARYPNQTLPPGTPDMYLVEWEELALKFGLEAFRDALSKAIRSSRFFPDPQEIRELLQAKKREAAAHAESRKLLRQMDEWKAQWQRERLEGAA